MSDGFHIRFSFIFPLAQMIDDVAKSLFMRVGKLITGPLWPLCLSLAATGQEILPDTSIAIPEVVITARRRQDMAAGQKTMALDSALLARHAAGSMAALLSSETTIAVRSYGVHNLALPSFRGTGTSHTAILWNGTNLSSPMNGQVDLNLLPVSLFSAVDLTYGGGASLWGSGTIGGSIHLQNTVPPPPGFHIAAGFSAGSFGRRQPHCKIGFAGKYGSASVHAYAIRSQNNFPYHNIAAFGQPLEYLENARTEIKGLMSANTLHGGKHHRLHLRLWTQAAHRQIPASMTSASTTATQEDGFLRSQLAWEWQRKKLSVAIRTSFFDETLTYTNPEIGLESHSQTESWVTEGEGHLLFKQYHALQWGINAIHSRARSVNFPKDPTQDRLSLFAAYKVRTRESRWEMALSGRQEYVRNGANAFTFSAGGLGRIGHSWQVRAQAGRNYRLPTFNDLYWTPGGNPALQPEEGWNAEGGLGFVSTGDKAGLKGDITVYSNWVDNWIIWLPRSSGLWSPENVLKVWARGWESALRWEGRISKSRYGIFGEWNRVLSTQEETRSDPQVIGKQLIYVPQTRWVGGFTWYWRKISGGFAFNYTGPRFTSSDNTAVLPGYGLTDMHVGWTVTAHAVDMNIRARIHNVFDTAYQAIAYYAMPGRNYEISMSIQYHKLQKKKP